MKKFIDLTMTIHDNLLTYKAPWHPKVKIEKLATFRERKRETSKITIGTHSGTHIDSPRHFIAKGKTIEKIHIEQLCGKAIILNFSKAPFKKKICIKDLKKKIGSSKLEKKLIIRYDWEIRSTRKNYFTHHPYLSKAACEWLVKKKIDLLGFDCPQPDNPLNSFGSKNDAENHKILLKNNIIIVEYLINLRKIKRKKFQLFVCPLKIKNGDGAPSRCFAEI